MELDTNISRQLNHQDSHELNYHTNDSLFPSPAKRLRLTVDVNSSDYQLISSPESVLDFDYMNLDQLPLHESEPQYSNISINQSIISSDYYEDDLDVFLDNLLMQSDQLNINRAIAEIHQNINDLSQDGLNCFSRLEDLISFNGTESDEIVDFLVDDLCSRPEVEQSSEFCNDNVINDSDSSGISNANIVSNNDALITDSCSSDEIRVSNSKSDIIRVSSPNSVEVQSNDQTRVIAASCAGPTLMDIESALATINSAASYPISSASPAFTDQSATVDAAKGSDSVNGRLTIPDVISTDCKLVDSNSLLMQLCNGASSSCELWPRHSSYKALMESNKVTRRVSSEEEALCDGYKWRKYGQKTIKSSTYPRSYYKCSSNSCNAKKQVERCSKTGVFMVSYEGLHLHHRPLPLPSITTINVCKEKDTSVI